MAASDCIPVTFLSVRNDTFYISVGDSEVDGDTLTDSSRCPVYYLQCEDNKFLYLNAESEFELQHLTSNEKSQLDCKFNIHIFHNTSLQEKKGVAVMIYVNKGGKKIVACCRGNNEVYAETMQDIPKKIEDSQHRAVFYMTMISHKYMFQSALYPSKFLGFEPDVHNPTLKVMVLRVKGVDSVDEKAEITLTRAQT